MIKITGLSHLFKWENLHNWWLTKYFFAPLYLYIHPIESPYFNDDSFSILEGEINHFQAQEHVLVCGDLIARTGQETETLSTQDKHLPGGDSNPSPIWPSRHNNDKTTNKNRSQVLQLCRMLGLYIVNGRL